MVVLTEILQEPSSSSSSLTNTHRYDVFISYRGADTGHGFTAHLQKVDANIISLLGDGYIETGDLKPELESAIKASRASIIVLSKNYASSTWCLDELVLILEQHRISDQIVIPIFFHVDPSDIRKQQNSFGDAMAKHKQKMDAETNADKKSQWAQKIEIWKKALRQVSDLQGKDANGRLETEIIKDIVDDIYTSRAVSSRALPLLIGMDYSIHFISSWLKDGSSHTADILTISGMNGIGKTSLAKYVYELHHNLFERSSFILDINRKCLEQSNKILDIQKQLYSDISEQQSIVQVDDVSDYTSKIEMEVEDKKVLLVLDDVDSLDHLYVLLGKKGFHSGSKIIITTKDASMTKSYILHNSNAEPKHTMYTLKGLDETSSLQLLSFHAFKSLGPVEGYKQVSKELAKFCEGHPLALNVLGKSLHDQDVAEWDAFIEEIKKETHSHIEKLLRRSFDSLPSLNDKELFLYIACFFVGMDRGFTETILKACGIRTLYGIRILLDRCLLTIGPRNELMMHKLLQDMGRDVVRQESPEKPWKRSRIWCHKESFNVMQQKRGKGNLKGMVLDMRMLKKSKSHGSVKLETDALSKMDNLKLLQLNFVQLIGSYKNFPKELRWLCMHGFPSQSVPSDLPVENLVALDMSYSNLEYFDMSYSNPQRLGKSPKLIGPSSKDKRLLGSLKILNLSFCRQLRSLGGFIELPALESLIVSNCIALTEVSESIEQCLELVILDVSYCYNLKKLPIAKLKKVKTLVLDGCDIGEHPPQMRDMDSIKMLNAKDTHITSQASFSAIVEATPRFMKSLPIFLTSSLVRFSLKGYDFSGESFSTYLNSLSMLKGLRLDGASDLMPISVEHSPLRLLNLKDIDLEFCRCPKISFLTDLDSPSMLKKLRLISVKHSPIRWLKLKDLAKLEEIRLDVPSVAMPMSIEHPPLGLMILDSYSKKDNFFMKENFDPEKSPLKLSMPFTYSSFEIEGVVKIQPMAGVEGKLLHSLGWSNLEFLKERRMETYLFCRGISAKSGIQMCYENGIFSTFYGGEAMPNWILHCSKGSSISFTVPSSPNKLKGLNICYIVASTDKDSYVTLSKIIISNITKNRTWIYHHHIDSVNVAEECLIFLSHWMFGMNEMEYDDLVIVTATEQLRHPIRECGISFMFDDGKIDEEDPLGYYKSWNHIIGGDLSAFQTTTGVYILSNTRFLLHGIKEILPIYRPSIADGSTFKGYSKRKTDMLAIAPVDVQNKRRYDLVVDTRK